MNKLIVLRSILTATAVISTTCYLISSKTNTKLREILSKHVMLPINFLLTILMILSGATIMEDKDP